jgi:hypothetical protein
MKIEEHNYWIKIKIYIYTNTNEKNFYKIYISKKKKDRKNCIIFFNCPTLKI